MMEEPWSPPVTSVLVVEDDARAAQADRLREVVPVAVVERLVDCYAAAEEAVKHAD